MRVQGNVCPEAITVEPYLPIPGMAEVRLRENMSQLSENLFEYDEYTTLMKERPGLKEDIAINLTDWLTTLRTLEVYENACFLRDMREALAILGVSADE